MSDRECLAGRHLQIGWWALLFFLTLGLVLESLHGFKVGWYLDVSKETRRLLLTLGHAHGALLALINIAFSYTVQRLEAREWTSAGVASKCLVASTVLLPGGFLLGGLFPHGGDPGIGVILTPAGGLALLASVALTARAVARPA